MHVGVYTLGARAGAYGAAEFIGFVVDVAQSMAIGELRVLVLEVRTLLVVPLAVPIYALSGGDGRSRRQGPRSGTVRGGVSVVERRLPQ